MTRAIKLIFDWLLTVGPPSLLFMCSELGIKFIITLLKTNKWIENLLVDSPLMIL